MESRQKQDKCYVHSNLSKCTFMQVVEGFQVACAVNCIPFPLLINFFIAPLSSVERLYSFGKNSEGQLGLGNTTNCVLPHEVNTPWGTGHIVLKTRREPRGGGYADVECLNNSSCR